MSKGSSLEHTAVASRGAFEACFSNGLDLSDFSHSDSPTGVSHAASLLRRKQEESAQKLENEVEELNLAALIQERAAALQRAKDPEDPVLWASPPLPPTHAGRQSPLLSTGGLRTSDMISSAVVAMHTAEQKEEPKQKLGKRKGGNKLLSSMKPKHPVKTNVKAIKKSLRTKYK
jgi:hypothetical protein